jgi:hypothetical protein
VAITKGSDFTERRRRASQSKMINKRSKRESKSPESKATQLLKLSWRKFLQIKTAADATTIRAVETNPMFISRNKTEFLKEKINIY